ncbi:DNA-binding protein [Streptomyces roseicoloratus]|uniref:DNA-binding protein n=1 Tax=Streptomyces roseicoloratus TaxID=2508722 RepID=A0ABY9RYT0_9ACTN|nr:DNA-binding protein [Streptomyces roseicoloratus]WMX46334.1 DNA-binding protein [Streptomyces roseicoloratus]
MSARGISSVLPRLHTAKEVAEALGCSVWWVKERARRRLVPFTYVGGAYRFTAEHVAEIVRLHEEFPARAPQRPAPPAPVPPSREPGAVRPGPKLTARPPRRLLKAQSQSEYEITA